VASLLAHDHPVAPLDRLAREAVQGARTAMRGKRPEIVDAAVRTALRETVFRFELVIRINVTTHELLERETLIDAALSAHVALLTSEDKRTRQADETYAERFVTCRNLLAFRVKELRAAQEAREIVESRYLGGRGALFPDVTAAWAEEVKSTQVLADLTARLAEVDGVPAAGPPDSEALSQRTAELVADLVEPARSTALDKLGEGQRALDIGTGWLRAKMASTTIPAPGGPIAG